MEKLKLDIAMLLSYWNFVKDFLGSFFNALGDDEVLMARVALTLGTMDWTSDIGSGIYHFSRGNWEQGLLTIFIVVFGGILISVNAYNFNRYVIDLHRPMNNFKFV